MPGTLGPPDPPRPLTYGCQWRDDDPPGADPGLADEALPGHSGVSGRLPEPRLGREHPGRLRVRPGGPAERGQDGQRPGYDRRTGSALPPADPGGRRGP